MAIHEAKSAQRKPKHITRSAIRRAVVSSTAIETDQSVEQLERKLREDAEAFSHLKLAEPQST
ncbi:MAG: hypothetical protein L0H73_03935 [Nitrococcus sp.]|nr:hypothetical protein [Nitrococcus sp.]